MQFRQILNSELDLSLAVLLRLFYYCTALWYLQEIIIRKHSLSYLIFISYLVLGLQNTKINLLDHLNGFEILPDCPKVALIIIYYYCNLKKTFFLFFLFLIFFYFDICIFLSKYKFKFAFFIFLNLWTFSVTLFVWGLYCLRSLYRFYCQV